MNLSRRTLLAGTAAALPLSATAQIAAGVGRRTMNTVKAQITRLVDQHRDGVAPIVSVGDPVLRQVADPFDGQVDDTLLAEFIALLQRTMRAAPGVGLAAPQIGVPVRIAVLEDPATVSPEVAEARHRYPLEFFAAINPTYRPNGYKRRGFYEGCLSMPGHTAVVNRPYSVHATYTDPTGHSHRETFTGWQARIVQHETDHLHGTVYVDKLEPRSLSTTQNYLDNWNDPVPTRAARALRFHLD
ncbi:peptide deformylase [Kribbella sp. CA-293567]|uniref:peptide deformylase n=1 Tax=Kribbella sp. CA-293567 TaxID=3002436 RepID=UPI0022DDBE14|nr:peptide deformylase [Kribbella sp. CA-293567]WBQ07542.1 peptide deformylase [Kribbella sp. CA-293567]